MFLYIKTNILRGYGIFKNDFAHPREPATFACIEIIAVAILYFCTATSYSYTNVAPPRIAFRKKEYKLHWCDKMVNV